MGDGVVGAGHALPLRGWADIPRQMLHLVAGALQPFRTRDTDCCHVRPVELPTLAKVPNLRKGVLVDCPSAKGAQTGDGVVGAGLASRDGAKVGQVANLSDRQYCLSGDMHFSAVSWGCAQSRGN